MPGRPRPGPDADHAGRGDRALEPVELEVVVEQVADRHREDADQLVDVALARSRPCGRPRAAARRGRPGAFEPSAGGSRSIIGRTKSRGRGQQLLEPRVGLGVVLASSCAIEAAVLLDLVEEEDRPVGGQRGVGGVERDRAVAEVARARGRRRSSAAASRRRRRRARRGRRARPPR